jgi:hypothetical protein
MGKAEDHTCAAKRTAGFVVVRCLSKKNEIGMGMRGTE